MNLSASANDSKSPPVRGRGLKRDFGSVLVGCLKSPPVRGRGLKRST